MIVRLCHRSGGGANDDSNNIQAGQKIIRILIIERVDVCLYANG